MTKDNLKKHREAKDAEALKMWEKASGGMVWFGVVRASALHSLEINGPNREALHAAFKKFDEKACQFKKSKGTDMSPNDIFQLMLSAYFLGTLCEPLPETQEAIKGALTKANTANMRDKKAEKAAPKIDKRNALLRNKPDDYLLKIGASRKEADAAALEFNAECEAVGAKTLSGKQLQRVVRDILKERRESSGHS